MPLIDIQTPAERLDFEGSLAPSEIDSLVANKKLKILQTSKPSDSNTWNLLNSRLFSVRTDVELRVYGHYGASCDLSFVAQLPNLRRFAADCLIEATGVEFIESLTNIERLSVGIYRLESFDFLKKVNPERLTHLSLGATFSKKPRLNVLERFSSVQQLYVEGQNRDVDVIGELKLIQDLTLRSITVPSLGFLNNLPKLWSLDIKLGGTTNLSDLASIKGVKYLELWQIKGLNDLSPISEMYGLQFLFLQALRNVERLPDLSRLTALRRIILENMKGLIDLTSLVTAPALEEFLYISAQGRDPQQFKELLATGILKRMLVGFGSERKNAELTAMQEAAGIESYSHHAFQYA